MIEHYYYHRDEVSDCNAQLRKEQAATAYESNIKRGMNHSCLGRNTSMCDYIPSQYLAQRAVFTSIDNDACDLVSARLVLTRDGSASNSILNETVIEVAGDEAPAFIAKVYCGISPLTPTLLSDELAAPLNEKADAIYNSDAFKKFISKTSMDIVKRVYPVNTSVCDHQDIPWVITKENHIYGITVDTSENAIDDYSIAPSVKATVSPRVRNQKFSVK